MNIPADLNNDDTASEQFTDSGVSEGEDIAEDQTLSRFYCRACNYSGFKSRYHFEQHLLRHVSTPSIVVERLCRSGFQKSTLTKATTTPRKSAAIKSVSSYIVPKIKSKHSPLKLTLKLSQETGNKERSFEVVAPRTILLGPGECFALNGGPLDRIKTEQESSQEAERDSVSGVEGQGEEVPAPEHSSGAEQAQDQQESGGEEAANTEGTEAPNQSAQGGGDGPSNEGDEDFMPPERSFSPNMVQVNSGALVDPSQSCSPEYPSTSPNLPETEQHISQQCDGDGTNSGDGHRDALSDENSNCRDDPSSLVSEDTHHANSNFSWADVSSSGMDPLTPTSQQQEERDPLMLPDQNQQGMMQGDENPNSILGLGGPPADGVGAPGSDGGDPLLRGFLCEQPPADKTAVPVAVSEAGSMEGLGLGSEYISLERLGDSSSQVPSGSFYCDVCGERASDHSALEEHRTRACHYKCTHSDCGGMVLATADELLAHQNACHGGPPPPPPPPQYIHAVPVEQLAQQVQRLPAVSLTQTQQLMPTSQPQYLPQPASPDAVHHPPSPLYRGHSPNQLSPQPQPQPYGQQVIYGQAPQQQQQQPPQQQQQQQQPQQQYQMPPQQLQAIPTQQLQQQPPQQQQPQQQQTRTYTLVAQQQPQSPQRMQQHGNRMGATTIGRGGTQMSLGQKRTVGQAQATGQGASPNKQRRMDVLLPDRHEDPDCHVIAIQKPTESGPLITSVQGGLTATSRSDMIQLTDSITLSVRNQKQVGGVNGGQVVGGRGRNKANEVANVLASRGITVTPAADTARGAGVQAQTSPLRGNRGAVGQPVQQQVPTLNLNAAISIIRTDNQGGSPVRQRQRTTQPAATPSFAVPQGRSPGRPQQLNQVERPPRPPTVDLTGDGPPHALHHMPMRRGRGRGINMGGRFTCQICDKQFAAQETLNQHMNITHRSPPNKLPYRCNLCSAQYPTQQGLTQHRQAFHKESLGNTELVIPVVDLKQAGALSRLANLGVHHYVPLSQLNSPQGGYFGLPLMSVDASGRVLGSLPGMTGLSTGTVFNLGPLRQLPR